MTDDLKIIKQLEKQTGVILEQRSFEEIKDIGKIGFSINEKGQVTGFPVLMNAA